MPNVPCVALTATATAQTVEDIIQNLRLKNPVAKFKTSCFRSNIYYDIVMKDVVHDPIEDLKRFALTALGRETNSEEENSVIENWVRLKKTLLNENTSSVICIYLYGYGWYQHSMYS